MATSHNLLILGGGFAGISAAQELGRLTAGDDSIHIQLVSDENFFVFQPLLPEVVSCSIEPTHVSIPLRQLCPRVQFHCATVRDINTKDQEIQVVGSDARHVLTLAYDQLLICVGMTVDHSRIPGMAAHAFPMKNLGDALHLRNHVLTCLEEAELTENEALRKKALTFVTIGGGFSGVETAAEINDMIASVLRYYPRAQAMGHRLILVQSGERILKELDVGLADYASRKLGDRGIEILLKRRVREVTPWGVLLDDERTIEASTVICTVGNAPHPFVLQSDLPQHMGRLIVESNLRVQGKRDVWACGDAAWVPDLKGGGWCPPTAQYATRQGIHLARNVLATIRQAPVHSFQHRALGQMAVVGHRSAVAQLFGWKFSGMPAWFLWRLVYFLKLPGMRTKFRVGIDWLLDLLFPRDITKIDVHRTTQLQRAHFRQGEIIIRQGELGDRFYLLESGEVEIFRDEPGQPEHHLAVRRAGESFGEIALLKEVRRQATVRCLTPVDVVSVTPQDFHLLMASSPLFRQQVTQAMERIAELPD